MGLIKTVAAESYILVLSASLGPLSLDILATLGLLEL